MSPYHLLERHTKLYKPKRDKIYFGLAAGDIIQIQTRVIELRYTIEHEEMFEFIENIRGSLYRVRRISNGKVYKMWAAKFLTIGSLSHVKVWEEISRKCIWNKKK